MRPLEDSILQCPSELKTQKFGSSDLLCPDSDRERSVCFPFGFDTVEISSNSNEDMSFIQKDILCPDSDRERSVSPLRVRYSGDYSSNSNEDMSVMQKDLSRPDS